MILQAHVLMYIYWVIPPFPRNKSHQDYQVTTYFLVDYECHYYWEVGGPKIYIEKERDLHTYMYIFQNRALAKGHVVATKTHA